MIKLERLLRCGVGTSKVEKLGLRLAKEANGGRRGPAEEREMRRTIRRKVMMIMRDKLQDAERDLKLARVQFHKSKKQLWNSVPWPSRAGAGARSLSKASIRAQCERPTDETEDSYLQVQGVQLKGGSPSVFVVVSLGGLGGLVQ